MNIAISASTDSMTGAVDERFGRARGFFLLDDKEGNPKFLDNTANQDAGHGAGIASAQMLIDAHVEVVLTGRVGPKASQALTAAGIIVEVIDGALTVESAWKAYQEKS